MTLLQDALDSAYSYLGHRDRTVAEIRAHLVDKKLVAERVAQEAIDELIEQGYLDDARFARRFAEDRRALDSWGNERIARRLDALGVDSEAIDIAIGAREAVAELDAAVALLRRRYPAPLCDARERQRALGVLLRKGYESDVAYDAVRRLAASETAS